MDALCRNIRVTTFSRRTRWKTFFATLLMLFSVSCFSTVANAQTGHVLEGVGPVNQSMGGAGTALPLDALGAMHWNPASITALESSEIGFGFAAFMPASSIESSVDAGAFGPGFPAGPVSGKTSSDIDIMPMPTFGFVYVPEDSPWVYGFGGFAIAGFGVDYAASATNPITTPQPPNGFGFGAIYSSFQMMQVSATVACRLTENWSVGAAPTVTWASLGVSPFPGATPNDANGDGFFTYPRGAQNDSRWGLGLQVGVFYENQDTGWNFGLSYKTTQWLDKFQINAQDELGAPLKLGFDMDYPAILSIGTAYTGFDRWDIAFDVRYIDYKNTDGFSEVGFDATGAVKGFGWKSIWVTAIGAQYYVSPTFRLRAGYTYNDQAITSDTAFFNSHACAIVQHHVSTGFTWETPHGWELSVAYKHAFAGHVTGPWQGPAGPIPGTSLTNTLKIDSVVGGVSVKF